MKHRKDIQIPASATDGKRGDSRVAVPYKMALTGQIILYFFAIALFAFGIATIYDAVQTGVLTTILHGSASLHDYISTLMGLILLLLPVFAILYTRRDKVYIYEDRIVKETLFGTRVLFFDSIESVLPSYGNGLEFVPYQGAGKKITFGVYYRDYHDVERWAGRYFHNYFLREKRKDRQAIRQNSSLGANAVERLNQNERNRLWARAVNILANIVTVALIFVPMPYYRYVFLAAAAMPWLASIVFIKSKGTALFDVYRDSTDRPTLFSSTYLVSLVLLCFALRENIIDIYPLIPYMLLCIVVVSIPFLWYNFSFTKSRVDNPTEQFIFVLFFAIFYAIGTIITYNVAFDDSEPDHHISYVKDKFETSGRSHAYKVRFASCGTMQEDGEITVSKKEYETYQEGDRIDVDEYKGALGAAFYMAH